MTPSRTLRLILASLLILLFLLGLAATLWLTESFFNVWRHLDQAPDWFFYAYLGGLGLLSSLVGILLLRLILPAKKAKPADQQGEKPPPPTREVIEEKIEQTRELGAQVHEAKAELAQLDERRAAGEIHVALFGEISSGKSSLVKALIPDAEPRVAVTGGTTRDLQQFTWTSPAGDQLILTDMPGLNEATGDLDGMAAAEAQRAHVVVYVCEGDLTRSQYQALQTLLQLGKPTVLALNKIDRFRDEDLALVRDRLVERVHQAERVEVVGVQAGGTRELVRVLPDGSEELVLRELPPKVDDLRASLQRIIDGDRNTLDELRDSAVFVLVSQRLDQAAAQARQTKADEIVSSYAKKAVVGALAAVTPGTDLIIQGYLGSQMVKELAELYQVPVRKVDTDMLLQLVQTHVGRSKTLLLALAGNTLKAFPGVGTLAGGVLHAIAYGLIFDTLGRALATTLATRGALHPVQTASLFEETLGDDLEATAKRLARVALAAARDSGSRPKS